MCGIVLAAGKLGINEEKVFKRLLELDTARGPHSTGILSVGTMGRPSVVKAVGTPWDLYGLKKFDDQMRLLQRAMIGHNRWATQGAINATNAHPFTHKHITGVHNGTLRGQYKLDNYKDFEVDSDNIYHHMAKNGVDDTIANLDGAFALVWYDEKAESINIVRNKERPFYITSSEDNQTVFGASESWMIEIATRLAGVKIQDIIEVPVGKLITFELNVKDGGIKNVDTREVELYKPPVYVSNYVAPRTTNPDTAPKTGLATYVKKFVDFAVEGIGISASGQQYIKGTLNDDTTEEIEIRVYVKQSEELWDKLMASPNYFTCEVGGYCDMANGRYLIALTSSVIENIEIDDAYGVEDDDIPFDDPQFVVYRGEIVNEKAYIALTHKGCAWCTGKVDTHDAESLHWVSANEFVCGDCAQQDDVKQYLNQAA